MTSLRRGVLRHKPPVDLESKDKFEDLLVFGYACKLFRDDEKALYIDQGKHLIPWMGDENIKIDRYDARGTLFDLKQYEMPQGGYNRYEGLTPEEKHMEELCDEERYFALYKDEEEEAIIKEEEIKRLHQDVSEAVSNEVTYHQVPFSYSNQQDGGDENTVSEPTPQKSLLGELGDAIYVPPPELDLPPDIVVPPTQKLARIIEKTANFISSQGAQMEIVLKAKQANNPMFQFLHFDSALHPFYRHILTAIRSGSYVVSVEEESADVDKTEEKNGKNSVPQTDSSDSEDEHYLHPSLQSGLNQISSANEIPSESIPFVYPPPTVQPIIDKTASYVARNGRSFETVITSKGDSRFMFLKDDHAFHSYYLHKLKTYTEMNGLKFELTVATSLPVDEKNENQIPERKPESEVKSTQEDDEEQLRNERRKKAVLFLNKLRQEKPLSNILSLEDKLEETGDPSDISSNVKTKRKSDSSDDVEIIDAFSKNRTKRSYSRSPSPYRRRRHRKSRSRSRSRRRSRSRSTERRRRHHKKHRDRSRDRSRDRHRRDRKRKHSHDRSRKKTHRHRSRSRSTVSRSPVKSRSSSQIRLSPTPINVNVQKVSATSLSSSETSSPLPPQLQPIQPALAKIAEGIRAKVMAMIDGDRK